MSLSRAIARPLLSSMFVYGGLDALQHPESKVKTAEPVAGPIAERIPHLTTDTETLIRINGAVMVGAGVLLATGKFRRLASAALIASLVPTTYAGHRFWEESDDVSKAQQRIHFLKNMGLLGGLILAALDEGRPSWSWRAKGTARRAQRASRQLSSRATRDAPNRARTRLAAFSRWPERSARRTTRAAAQASRRAGSAAQPMVSGGVPRAGQLWGDVAEHLPVPS
jgi:putative oxidoreductase